jgi:hypothetical protein
VQLLNEKPTETTCPGHKYEHTGTEIFVREDGTKDGTKFTEHGRCIYCGKEFSWSNYIDTKTKLRIITDNEIGKRIIIIEEMGPRADARSNKYVNIPYELKTLTNWVGWKLETRDGKPTKVPYSQTGIKASTTDPTTWKRFEDVSEIQSSKEKGIGFVFDGVSRENKMLIGIDLDKCLDSEYNITDEKFNTITQILKSYTEITPSDKGLHIIIKCNEHPYYSKDTNGKEHFGKRKNNIEIYSKERYFTFTGNKWKNSTDDIKEYPVSVIRLALDSILNPHGIEKILPTKETHVISQQITKSLSDEEIINIASKSYNSDKFKSLMGGSISGNNNDRSAADMALANILAFYTTDPNQIERIMRKSGLVRDKWNRVDYIRNYTIDKAIRDSTSHYDPQYTESQKEPVDISGILSSVNPTKQIPIEETPALMPVIEDEPFFLDVPPSENLISKWVEFGKLTQDAYEEYHLCTILVIISHLIRAEMRPQYAENGVSNNMFGIILGPSGVSGKSTATSGGMAITYDDRISSHVKRIATKITPEILAISLQGEHTRGIHYVDEAVGFMKFMKKEYATDLAEDYIKAYDGAKLSKETMKNGLVVANTPHLSALWNTVPEAFGDYADKEQFTSGFFLRAFFIMPTRKKEIKEDEAISDQCLRLKEEIISEIENLIKLIGGRTVVFAESKRMNTWKRTLREKSAGSDYSEMERSTYNRVYDQARKAAMNLTLTSSEFKTFLENESLYEGNMPKMLQEIYFEIPEKYITIACDWAENVFYKTSIKAQKLTYGKGKFSKLMKALSERKQLSRTEIGDIVSIHGRTQLNDFISELGLVVSEEKKVGNSSKPTTFYKMP